MNHSWYLSESSRFEAFQTSIIIAVLMRHAHLYRLYFQNASDAHTIFPAVVHFAKF